VSELIYGVILLATREMEGGSGAVLAETGVEAAPRGADAAKGRRASFSEQGIPASYED
jgi:hypothetical protein